MNLLLVDKDGTLIKTKSGEKFINKPWDQEALSGVREGLKYYKQRDWKIVVMLTRLSNFTHSIFCTPLAVQGDTLFGFGYRLYLSPQRVTAKGVS